MLHRPRGLEEKLRMTGTRNAIRIIISDRLEQFHEATPVSCNELMTHTRACSSQDHVQDRDVFRRRDTTLLGSCSGYNPAAWTAWTARATMAQLAFSAWRNDTDSNDVLTDQLIDLSSKIILRIIEDNLLEGMKSYDHVWERIKSTWKSCDLALAADGGKGYLRKWETRDSCADQDCFLAKVF